MRHVIEYRNDSDDGNTDADSIVPYVNGEGANQTVFRRTPENLRRRSETLRNLVREHIVLGDLDRQGLIFHSTGTGAFNGTVNGGGDGKFVLTQDLHVYPFATPGDASGSLPYVASTVAFQAIGTYGVNQIWLTSVQKQFEGTDLEPADANKISIEITHTGSLGISVSGPTGEERNILVTINSASTTCTQVINLINGDPAASALVSAMIEPTSNPANLCSVYDNSVWLGDYAQRFLVGGAPGTLHTITAVNLAGFFAAHADNPMKAGDMIGIWYEHRIDPTTAIGGRLQSTPENAKTVIPQASLFNSRRESHKIPNCIPLFKCIDDNTVIAADGTRFVKGDSGTFGGAEGSALATPLGWAVINTGTHNPPTTIREALDNCDAQIEIDRDHFQSVITVTDGTSSAGGKYNGAGALENALTDYGTSGGTPGSGALILVRAGTYNIANQLTIDRSVEVRAIEDNVSVNLTLPDFTYALVLANTGGAHGHTTLSGLNFTGANKYAITATGIRHCTLEKLFFGCARGIDLQTCERVDMTALDFETSEECLIIGANASECSAKNLKFVTTATTVPAFTYSSTLGKCSVLNSYFDMTDNQQAVSVPGYGLQMDNTRVDCRPYTAASTVVVVSGSSNSFKGLYLVVKDTGNILGGLIQISGTANTLRDMQATLNDQPLAYTGANNPFIFGGSSVLVESVLIMDLFLADNNVMSLAEPIVVVLGGASDQPTTIRDMTIRGFTHTGAPTGNIACTVIGNRASFVGLGTVFILDNIQIDTSGKTYTSLGASQLIGNISPESIIKNCKFTGIGQWNCAIHVDGSDDVQVRNNLISVNAINWSYGIWVDSNTTTAPHGTSDKCLVDGNEVLLPSFTAVAGIMIGDTSDITFCNRPRCANNLVIDGTATQSINFLKVDKGISMGNNVSNGITYNASCTNMKPDGVTIGLADVNVLA